MATKAKQSELLLRTELVNALETVKTALSDKTIIPILSHFWFTGKDILAYNDQISISVPFPTNFAGAVPITLLKMIKLSRHKEINIDQEDDNLLVSAGRLRLKLPVMPSESFVFTMPSVKTTFEVTDDFLSKVKSCLFSVRFDNVMEMDMMGITLIPSDNGLIMLSYNGGTMSCAFLKENFGLKDTVILSGDFCDQLVPLSKGTKATIGITKDYSLMTSEKGVTLFGKVIKAKEPLPLRNVFERYRPKDSTFVKIPSALERILERSSLIISGSIQSSHAHINCTNGKMTFASNSERGNLVESILIDKHQNIDVEVQPKVFIEGCSTYSNMVITEDCVALTNDKKDTFYLMTVRTRR